MKVLRWDLACKGCGLLWLFLRRRATAGIHMSSSAVLRTGSPCSSKHDHEPDSSDTTTIYLRLLAPLSEGLHVWVVCDVFHLGLYMMHMSLRVVMVHVLLYLLVCKACCLRQSRTAYISNPLGPHVLNRVMVVLLLLHMLVCRGCRKGRATTSERTRVRKVSWKVGRG